MVSEHPTKYIKHLIVQEEYISCFSHLLTNLNLLDVLLKVFEALNGYFFLFAVYRKPNALELVFFEF